MSDSVVKIIPKDMNHVPPADRHGAALALFIELIGGGYGEIEVYENVAYIDQGELMMAVFCPNCGRKTTIEDVPHDDEGNSWWDTLIDRLAELAHTPPGERDVQMPCCNVIMPLTALTFENPAGFARFELCSWNPSSFELDEKEMAKLESLLGCELKLVYAHY